jgi:hypothetical protein
MFTQAIALAKAQFEAYLLEAGTSATWKRRAAVTPTSESNDITQQTGRYDPQATGYGPEWNNTTLFPTATQSTILVCKDVPDKSAAVNAGQMVTGSTTGYTAVANVVEVGDYLVIGSEVWAVTGARLVSPAIYRELTVEKRA